MNEQISSKLDNIFLKKLLNNSNQSDKNMSTNAFEQFAQHQYMVLEYYKY